MLVCKSHARELQSGADGGFALVVVLAVLGLISLVVISFSLAVRSHLRSVAAIGASARAEALADGGVELAVADLLAVREDRTRARRHPVDATPVACRMADGGKLTIAVQDEAGRVDINSGSDALLLALMRGSGLSDGEASMLVDRLLDYRDRDEERRPLGAERPEYAAAGLPGPKNAPFDAVDELQQVLGADARIFDRIQDAATVHSGLAGVDPRVMPAGRVALLATGDAAAGAAFGTGSRVLARGALSARLVGVSPLQVFSIRSEAETPDGARFVREAIVDLGPRRAPAHAYKRWVRGSSRPSGQGSSGTGTAPAARPMTSC